MPAAGSRHSRFPIINGIGYVEGVRGRDAAQLLAYELGYHGALFDNLEAGMNLFWNEYDAFRMYTPKLGPPGLLLLEEGDGGMASIFGLEMDAEYRAMDKLTLLGNYTFERMDWRGATEFTMGTDYIEPPEHKFMAGARYDATDDLHLSSHLYYVGAVNAPNTVFPFVPKAIDAYFRLDVQMEWEFWDDRASFTVGGRNLTDSGHFEGASVFLNDGEVPRVLFAELRLRL